LQNHPASYTIPYMSGHNKFSKIKHKKAASDAKKSQVFTKISKLITSESKKCGGDVNSPGLATVIIMAKKENMPKDTIDRAVKKGTDVNTAAMEQVMYETYGPGGCAIVIEGLTDNKNRTAPEIRHILSKSGYELAPQGAAIWAFSKQDGVYVATTTVDLSEGDLEKLESIVEKLEENEDVQNVYTNAANLE
jgi:YebC/PmpR family DNA-binding regulatory protein